VDVVAVEASGCRGGFHVLADLVERDADERPAHGLRDVEPLLVGELDARGRSIEVAPDAATPLGADALDRPAITENAQVVAHLAGLGGELAGDVGCTADPPLEQMQDAHAQRVGDGLGEPRGEFVVVRSGG
jgi:hypothetical protein